jgi:hypothetical protein
MQKKAAAIFTVKIKCAEPARALKMIGNLRRSRPPVKVSAPDQF